MSKEHSSWCVPLTLLVIALFVACAFLLIYSF